MKLLKSAALLTAGIVFGSALWAEGLKVSGYIRSGVEADLDDSSMQSQTYDDGYFYGVAKSRLRVNVKYDQENYGLTFRYQASKFGLLNKSSFDESGDLVSNTNTSFCIADNLKWAQGYAKLFNGLVVAEGGLLKDTYTASTGFEGYDFSDYYGGVAGARLVVLPVQGLALSFQASSLYSEVYDATSSKKGKTKLNENLFSASASYANDVFSVAGGYHFAGEGYASFGLYAVKDLTLQIEADYLSKDLTGSDDASTTLVENIEYDIKDANLSLGVVSYEYFAEDTAFDIYPYARIGFLENYAATLEAGFHNDGDSDTDDNISVTPSVSAFAGKAEVKAYFTYNTEGNAKTGINVKVSF